MVLLLTYDLHNPGRDYEAIRKVLEGAKSHKHPRESVWLLDTARTVETWRDKLKAAGDPNDEFLVVRLRKNWATSKVDKDTTDWLKHADRSW